MQKWWIWELLQNPRDASADDDTHLVASVELGNGELVFQHNGRGFTMEEVAHLIYHGSTKLEDEKTIGQYGSGFLTTHLLSPAIDVSGQLNDGSPFKFRLKREISSAKALSVSMDQAWNEFDGSESATSDIFTTRFRYPMSKKSSQTPAFEATPLFDPRSCYHGKVPIVLRRDRRTVIVRENERGGSLIAITVDADQEIDDSTDRFETAARSDFSERYHRETGVPQAAAVIEMHGPERA